MTIPPHVAAAGPSHDRDTSADPTPAARQAFAQRLRLARLEAGLTQLELAQQLGVTRQTVWCWEIARYEPSIELLGKLARALGVSTDWLVGTRGHNDPA